MKNFAIFVLFSMMVFIFVLALVGFKIKDDALALEHARAETWIENYNNAVASCNADAYNRQRRIFMWEICSMFNPCMQCVGESASPDGYGNVEHCFVVSCDGPTAGTCSELLDLRLDDYFSQPNPYGSQNANLEDSWTPVSFVLVAGP